MRKTCSIATRRGGKEVSGSKRPLGVPRALVYATWYLAFVLSSAAPNVLIVGSGIVNRNCTTD